MALNPNVASAEIDDIVHLLRILDGINCIGLQLAGVLSPQLALAMALWKRQGRPSAFVGFESFTDDEKREIEPFLNAIVNHASQMIEDAAHLLPQGVPHATN